MKRILVYGDSNTWGSKAFNGRYPTSEQWPNILQTLLGDKYEVIQEGLCGRIAGNHDVQDTHRNGKIGFEISIRSACPIDLVIIALGTNDLKPKYGLSPDTIYQDLLWYKKLTLDYAKSDKDMINKNPQVIYLGIANYREDGGFAPAKGSAEKVNKLLAHNNNSFIKLDNLEHSEDGLHYSKNDHKKVAQKVYKKILEYEK